MRSPSRYSKGYTLENALVLVMIGSAVILQMRQRKRGAGVPVPLLVRAVDAVPSGFLPWPIEMVRDLLS